MDYSSLLKNDSRRLFLTPKDFLAAAVEYFEWAEENPLQEAKVFQFQGDVIEADLNKVRAFTKAGLATYLGIPVSRLESYKGRKDPEWREVVEIIEQVIYTQKFEHAAAGLMNSNIIVRDLGLTDKQEVDTTANVQVENKQPEVPAEHQAIHIHPDDPDPLNLPRPMYSQAQIDAGVPFTAPTHDA